VYILSLVPHLAFFASALPCPVLRNFASSNAGTSLQRSPLLLLLFVVAISLNSDSRPRSTARQELNTAPIPTADHEHRPEQIPPSPVWIIHRHILSISKVCNHFFLLVCEWGASREAKANINKTCTVPASLSLAAGGRGKGRYKRDWRYH